MNAYRIRKILPEILKDKISPNFCVRELKVLVYTQKKYVKIISNDRQYEISVLRDKEKVLCELYEM